MSQDLEQMNDWLDRNAAIPATLDDQTNPLLVDATALLLKKFPTLKIALPSSLTAIEAQRKAALAYVVKSATDNARILNICRAILIGFTGWNVLAASNFLASAGAAFFGMIGFAIILPLDYAGFVKREHAALYYTSPQTITKNHGEWVRAVVKNPKHESHNAIISYSKRSLAVFGVSVALVIASVAVKQSMTVLQTSSSAQKDVLESNKQPVPAADVAPPATKKTSFAPVFNKINSGRARA